MRSDRPATTADPTEPTAALERNYPGSTAPTFPAPTCSPHVSLMRSCCGRRVSVGMLRRRSLTRRIGEVHRYLIIIQASSFEDVDNVELPAPPQPGDPIETNLGTCIVTSTESMPAESEYAGKIICHLPGAR